MRFWYSICDLNDQNERANLTKKLSIVINFVHTKTDNQED